MWSFDRTMADFKCNTYKVTISKTLKDFHKIAYVPIKRRRSGHEYPQDYALTVYNNDSTRGMHESL